MLRSVHAKIGSPPTRPRYMDRTLPVARTTQLTPTYPSAAMSVWPRDDDDRIDSSTTTPPSPRRDATDRRDNIIVHGPRRRQVNALDVYVVTNFSRLYVVFWSQVADAVVVKISRPFGTRRRQSKGRPTLVADEHNGCRRAARVHIKRRSTAPNILLRPGFALLFFFSSLTLFSIEKSRSGFGRFCQVWSHTQVPHT